jgi:hypothetical protein
VLNNQELTRLIFDFLRGEVNAGWKNMRGIVASLAIVNHAFFHASADVNWRFMDSITPFLHQLPTYHKGSDADVFKV